MLNIILDIGIDSLKDSLIILPFLFLTYLLIEYLEHKTSNKVIETIKKSGKFGPFFGALLGLVPQCGFSASATTLYSGRIITIGTLIAIYLTTSDEMLPILIGQNIPFKTIVGILGIKFVIGIIFGFIIDLIYSKFKNKKDKNNDNKIKENINEMCETSNCHCSKANILKSSITHAFSVWIFIFIITFVLGIIIELIGENTLIKLFNYNKLLRPVLAGAIGLIPNCASSVIISQMFAENIISFATLISGLLVNSGVGILVLFKTNKNLKENIGITVIIYLIGVIVGVVLNLVNFSI